MSEKAHKVYHKIAYFRLFYQKWTKGQTNGTPKFFNGFNMNQFLDFDVSCMFFDPYWFFGQYLA